MAELKSNKRRTVLIIVIVLLGVVITAVFGYQGIVNPEQLEIRTTQTADARLTDSAADSGEEPPTATIPPADVQSTPTSTETPTTSLTNPVPQGTFKFTPELFIYHTP